MDLKHLIRYRKIVLRYFLVRLIFGLNGFGKKKSSNKIFFYFENNSLARYLYLNLHFFQNVFSVFLHPVPSILSDLRDYSKWIIQEKQVFIRQTGLNPDSLRIIYNNRQYNAKISYDYFSSLSSPNNAKFIMPYFMHPGQYKWDYHNSLSINIKKSRPLKVMFLGGVNKEHYDNPLISKKFKILSRYKVIEYLKSNINYIYPRHENEIYEFITKKRKELIIYNTNATVLWQKDWLKVLSELDFYLALPGVSMPPCHNLIEAMSVGAIPILQYNNYIYPKLENGKNCIVYSSLKELKTILDTINDYRDNILDEMRYNVIEYYYKYHSIAGFKNNISRFLENQNNSQTIEIILNTEYESAKLFSNK